METQRLYLRDYLFRDWESVHLYGKEPEFSRYEPWGPNTVEDTKAFIADVQRRARLVPRFHFEIEVCLKNSHLQIGGCGLRKETQNSVVANMGWAMNPSYQGQGYPTEAARRLLEYGFEDWVCRLSMGPVTPETSHRSG